MKFPALFSQGRLAIAIAALAIGTGLGTYAAPFFHHHAVLQNIRDFSNTYHFISPLLACGQDQDLQRTQAKTLKNSIEESIAVHTRAGDITDASVYYRDLNNGPWVGINYNEKFSPGSLLKVPLAMSVYKLAEANPALLTKKLNYTGEEVSDAQFFAPTPLAAGKYTIEELVQQMLFNSNNGAAHVLANAIGVDAFESTYEHLGITKPPADSSDYTTTTREYTSFFRILYSATYLDDVHSEQLLGHLSESSFTQGLVAGVPSGVVVAHKFGERSYSDSMTKQLHDCGIVYIPNHPYVICVMTRGMDFNKLAQTIADISRVAYASTE